MQKSLPCPSLWWHHLDLKTNIYGYISIFPRQHLIQVSIIYTHTHTHTNYIYIYIILEVYLVMGAHIPSATQITKKSQKKPQKEREYT